MSDKEGVDLIKLLSKLIKDKKPAEILRLLKKSNTQSNPSHAKNE